ncbi:MAG: hypothetical protein EZS28_014028 [Streblomastix strix]|uniref:Uncharacterized protein n=1 Tax=Streblomastix strix TaxID=222440 RepID=A0A5J4W6U4_9EUKA|nr:MAG: hypothetical protein EZS28_014028 [Streblomastix strix]
MLALILEPLRALICLLEQSQARLVDVFPALLTVFSYYEVIQESPTYKIPQIYKNYSSEISNALFDMTLDSDLGALYALAHSLTQYGPIMIQTGVSQYIKEELYLNVQNGILDILTPPDFFLYID